MTPKFILIHSPLAAPSTWQLVAQELARRKRTALTPHLPLKDPPFQSAFAAQVAADAENLPGWFVLVAHSAAGAYLPAIVAALRGRVAACLFVDARLPVSNASLLDSSPPDFAARVQALAQNGMLIPWPAWFGPDAMQAILPEASTRAAFVADCPPIPLALFEEVLPEVDGWPESPCAYLQFSPPYAPEAEEARRRGWLTARYPAGHLHMLIDPPAVARSLFTLTEHLLEGKPNYPAV